MNCWPFGPVAAGILFLRAAIDQGGGQVPPYHAAGGYVGEDVLDLLAESLRGRQQQAVGVSERHKPPAGPERLERRGQESVLQGLIKRRPRQAGNHAAGLVKAVVREDSPGVFN